MNRRGTIFALIALGAAANPIALFAQQLGKIWRVGFLSPTSASSASPNTNEFLKGMRELGYVEGKNLIVEWRFSEGKNELLTDMAEELVRLRVDVIVASTSPAIGAAKKATDTIPIVMANTGDPVASGFVKSLARPEGNITGLSNMGGDTGPKLVDLLLAVVPKLSRLAVLVTPTSTTYRAIAESVRSAAQKVDLKTLVIEVSTPQEIENAFSRMRQERADAVIVGSAPLFSVQERQIADLALKHRMPSTFGIRSAVEAGGLMSYGAVRNNNYLRSAAYVDRILKGAKPGDLPVEQPVTLELVINLKTAKALGITIPQSLLRRADQVIE